MSVLASVEFFSFQYMIRILNTIWLLVICLATVPACNQQKSKEAPINQAEEWLTEILQKPFEQRVLAQPVIKDAKTAEAVAEALASGVYGEAKIKQQRPYQTTFVKGYWRVIGTLSAQYDGGVFEILLDAKDGRVVQLEHGK